MLVTRSMCSAPAFRTPQRIETKSTPKGLFFAIIEIMMPSQPRLLLKRETNRPCEPSTSTPPHSPATNPEMRKIDRKVRTTLTPPTLEKRRFSPTCRSSYPLIV